MSEVSEIEKVKVRVLKPVGDFVVVEPERIEQAEARESGLIAMHDPSKQPKPSRGIVVAVGPEVKKVGTMPRRSVDVGDVVIFNKYAGSEYKDEANKVFLILKEVEILATLE